MLFGSLALEYGPRAIGVVLTGMLDDGTTGLWAMKARGAVTIVQDPQDAEYTIDAGKRAEARGHRPHVAIARDCRGGARAPDSIVRFRCHTGHAFSLQTLLVDTDEAIDASLWNAIRAIEERALILREMQELAVADERDALAKDLAGQATDAEQRAQRIRDLVVTAS